MNHSKLYVPDPTLWINFYKSKSRKTLINQKGGNNIMSAKRTAEKPMNVELISPVEAGDDRTESTIRRIRRKTRPMRRPRQKRIKSKRKSHISRKRKTNSGKRRKPVKLRLKKKKRQTKTKKDIFSS